MPTVSENISFGRRFLPTIKSILGPLAFEEAPMDMDLHEATDLLLLKARDMRVACRMRRVGYWDKHPWQFTIRSKVPSGVKTELDKIIEGWGDWLFYGHQHHADATTIFKWLIIDLHNFRAHLIHRTDNCWGDYIPNGDGTCFAAWDVRNFARNPPLCVKTWTEIPAPTVAPQKRATFGGCKETRARDGWSEMWSRKFDRPDLV